MVLLCQEHQKKIKSLCVSDSCFHDYASMCEECAAQYHAGHATISMNRFQAELMAFTKNTGLFEDLLFKQLQKYQTQAASNFQKEVAKVVASNIEAYNNKCLLSKASVMVPFTIQQKMMIADVLADRGVGSVLASTVKGFQQKYLNEPQLYYEQLRNQKTLEIKSRFQSALVSIRLKIQQEFEELFVNQKQKKTDTEGDATVIMGHTRTNKRPDLPMRTENQKLRSTSQQSNTRSKGSQISSNKNEVLESSIWTKSNRKLSFKNAGVSTPKKQSNGLFSTNSSSMGMLFKEVSRRNSLKQRSHSKLARELKQKEKDLMDRIEKADRIIEDDHNRESRVLTFIQEKARERKQNQAVLQVEIQSQIQNAIGDKLKQAVEQIQKIVKSQHQEVHESPSRIVSPQPRNSGSSEKLKKQLPPFKVAEDDTSLPLVSTFNKVETQQNQPIQDIPSFRNIAKGPRQESKKLIPSKVLQPVGLDSVSLNFQQFSSKSSTPSAACKAMSKPFIPEAPKPKHIQKPPQISQVRDIEDVSINLPTVVATQNLRQKAKVPELHSVKESSISKLIGQTPKPEQTVLQNNESKIVKKTKKEPAEKPKFKISQNQIQNIQLEKSDIKQKTQTTNTQKPNPKSAAQTIVNPVPVKQELPVAPPAKPSLTKQELNTRLALIPKVSKFLQENLKEMEQAWRRPDNICWARFFQLRDSYGLDSSEFKDIRDRINDQAVVFSAEQLISTMQSNVDKIKINNVSKKKNYKVLKYLVLHSAEIVILLQGTNITRSTSRFVSSELNGVLDKMDANDAVTANQYIKNKVSAYRQI